MPIATPAALTTAFVGAAPLPDAVAAAAEPEPEPDFVLVPRVEAPLEEPEEPLPVVAAAAPSLRTEEAMEMSADKTLL